VHIWCQAERTRSKFQRQANFKIRRYIRSKLIRAILDLQSLYFQQWQESAKVMQMFFVSPTDNSRLALPEM